MDYKHSLKNKKVLITAGPTWIPIDAMRVISNQSSGELGRRIAADMIENGARVTLLEGPIGQQKITTKSVSLKKIRFTFFDELFKLIKTELKKDYDIVIHAAAVSDYKLKKTNKRKLSSRLGSLKLELVPTPKIIQKIKKINPNVFLVGFKLEPGITKISAKKKARSLIEETDCDMVVANGFIKNKYSAYIIDKKLNILTHKTTRQSLAKALTKAIQQK